MGCSTAHAPVLGLCISHFNGTANFTDKDIRLQNRFDISLSFRVLPPNKTHTGSCDSSITDNHANTETVHWHGLIKYYRISPSWHLALSFLSLVYNVSVITLFGVQHNCICHKRDTSFWFSITPTSWNTVVKMMGVRQCYYWHSWFDKNVFDCRRYTTLQILEEKLLDPQRSPWASASVSGVDGEPTLKLSWL